MARSSHKENGSACIPQTLVSTVPEGNGSSPTPSTLGEFFEENGQATVTLLQCHFDEIAHILSAYGTELVTDDLTVSPGIEALTRFAYQARPYCEVIAGLIRCMSIPLDAENSTPEEIQRTISQLKQRRIYFLQF